MNNFADGTGIGQPVRRVEDARFLTGRGRFVDDLLLARMAHGVVVYSPHAHARITRIDTRAAQLAPGVLCVLTGADAKAEGVGDIPPLYMPEDMGGPKGYRASRPVLCEERVRCVGDRVAFVVAESLSQALLGDTHARDQVVEGELALDERGVILAVRARSIQSVGAYTMATLTPTILSALRLIPNVYTLQAMDVSSQAVFTHTAPVAGYRGGGKPEAIYFIERLVDNAAHQLGIDPAELRRRNFITPEVLPYKTPSGAVYDSGEFAAAMDQAMVLSDAAGFAARRLASMNLGRLRGRGMSYYIESAGVTNDRMELRFDPGGTVSIVSGLHSHGQGHATVFAQLVSDWLGLPFASIRFLQGDTDQVPIGRGTYAARSALLGSGALRRAADAIIEKAKPMAAKLLEAAGADIEFDNGVFRVIGTDRKLAFYEVARAFYKPAGLKDFSVGLEASGSFAAEPPSYPNGCQICEVEIDPETGRVTLERCTVVDDIGRAINPMICDGQVHGGVAQGVGQALCERIVFDTENGQLLSGGFMDYAMPRADDLPDIDTGFHDVPCNTNPLGVKGVGEGGTIGAPPAIMAAVLDALRPLGVTSIDMPATSEAVWRAVANARLGSGRL
ncbi:MAG: xanthine dehydrogenase family protein molybdopterin-binding subunit [Burkholderiales bacterium]